GYSTATVGACLLLGASVGGELLNPGAPELLTVFKETGVPTTVQAGRYLPPLVFTQLAVSTAVIWVMSGWWERRAGADSAAARGGGGGCGGGGRHGAPARRGAAAPHQPAQGGGPDGAAGAPVRRGAAVQLRGRAGRLGDRPEGRRHPRPGVQ